jgi:large-conductance mechanosensitive channel
MWLVMEIVKVILLSHKKKTKNRKFEWSHENTLKYKYFMFVIIKFVILSHNSKINKGIFFIVPCDV